MENGVWARALHKRQEDAGHMSLPVALKSRPFSEWLDTQEFQTWVVEDVAPPALAPLDFIFILVLALIVVGLLACSCQWRELSRARRDAYHYTTCDSICILRTQCISMHGVRWSRAIRSRFSGTEKFSSTSRIMLEQPFWVLWADRSRLEQPS